MSLKQFAENLPRYAKDLRLNLGSILSDQLMGEERKLAILLACAHGSGHRPLVAAAEAEIEGKLSEEVANAARGAAAVMAMNNVYYRFVHLTSNPEYGKLPARLRMNFIGSHRLRQEGLPPIGVSGLAPKGRGPGVDSPGGGLFPPRGEAGTFPS